MMPPKQDTFKAWIDEMPPGPRKFICTGDVVEPTTGWVVTLERAQPQGINPLILLLNVKAVRPTGPAGQIVTTYAVRYEESPPKADYAEARISDGTGSFTIKVGRVE
jgi:hypothetical protein